MEAEYSVALQFFFNIYKELEILALVLIMFNWQYPNFICYILHLELIFTYC